MSLQEALDRTDPTKSKTVTNGGADEKDAIERFKDFYALFTQENVSARVRNVYAKDAYLMDAFKRTQRH